MHRYTSALAKLVGQAIDLPADDVDAQIRVPEPERGDLSVPCFFLAKTLKKNPAAIAAELADKLAPDARFTRIAAQGPYLNAFIDPDHLVNTIVPEVRRQDEQFGHADIGSGRHVVIDYSSPNIAKPLGFHHLRSTMIGNALKRIHQALGYRVVGINFLGDWGKTFGLLAEVFERIGDRQQLAEGKIAYLLELYVKANQLLKEDAEFDEAARAMFRRQESGDERAFELWQLFRTVSLEEFERIYNRLGVSFESYDGESHYKDGMNAVIEAIDRTAGTREDKGALVVDMAYADEEPPMMLRKSDGATLYATRDIAAAIDRYERFEFVKSLYVVGSEQRRHFDQLKRALAAMGHGWSEQMTHVVFGRVQGMSTREGNVVFLEDVLNEARDRAREKIESTAGARELDIETVAEQVGIGGIVFGDLKNLRTSDYTFNWEELLNPKGFTGICVQYAHARCCSILRKSELPTEGLGSDLSGLKAPEELALIKDLGRIPQAIREVAAELEPSRLARALYEVARSWNRYQQAGNADRSLRVLSEDQSLMSARLALVDAVRIGLRNGLRLLGVPTPSAM